MPNNQDVGRRRYADRHLRWSIPAALGAFRRRDAGWKDALIIALALKDLRLFKIDNSGLFRSTQAHSLNRLGRWLYDKLRSRQRPDTAHHAPACPANRWSGVALAVQPCTCRAWKIEGNVTEMNREQPA